ncbi:MAG: TlpA disulfide reductase family protein [Thermodesulfovibrionales bacterium]|jgi:peroxiredoxin
MKRLLFLLLLVASFALASLSFAAASPAPDFSLSTLDGKKVTLSSMKGKVVLLHFWASWCPPCKKELPSLVSLHREMQEKGLVVLAVSIDRSESALRSYMTENSLPFTVLYDRNKEVAFNGYPVPGLPTTYLIDRNGAISRRIVGKRDWTSSAMKDEVIRLLGGKK